MGRLVPRLPACLLASSAGAAYWRSKGQIDRLVPVLLILVEHLERRCPAHGECPWACRGLQQHQLAHARTCIRDAMAKQEAAASALLTRSSHRRHRRQKQQRRQERELTG